MSSPDMHATRHGFACKRAAARPLASWSICRLPQSSAGKKNNAPECCGFLLSALRRPNNLLSSSSLSRGLVGFEVVCAERTAVPMRAFEQHIGCGAHESNAADWPDGLVWRPTPPIPAACTFRSESRSAEMAPSCRISSGAPGERGVEQMPLGVRSASGGPGAGAHRSSLATMHSCLGSTRTPLGDRRCLARFCRVADAPAGAGIAEVPR